MIYQIIFSIYSVLLPILVGYIIKLLKHHASSFCKHDGSLNDGLEVVSHPITPEYH